jgi:hypothetical protein
VGYEERNGNDGCNLNGGRVQSNILVENKLNSDVFFSELSQKLFFIARIVELRAAGALITARALDFAVGDKHLQVIGSSIQANLTHITSDVVMIHVKGV